MLLTVTNISFINVFNNYEMNLPLELMRYSQYEWMILGLILIHIHIFDTLHTSYNERKIFNVSVVSPKL